ncbi:putative membrane protein [Okibacterium sp. HSC-33S16]|uniref:phage holin family protein n=1 Tax=Okibacterium sp. HSC-33S16 TaxID=2910965 RepID=UPI00209E61DD|nr:phage holin family protein [Okibacterium sp. HSC-33S16]MCP2031272.1 putative membrane protein [Okibacterium sp. HSC-33S16]
MAKFLLNIVINAVAIWLTTLIVAGVQVTPYAPNNGVATALTYLLVAFIFALVNSIIGTVIKIVAIPLYVLTLGLVSFLINGLLLLIVGWITSAFGFGLTVDGFWWAVLGALVISIINWIFQIILRPQRRDRR